MSVMNILMKKHHPEKFKEEQERADRLHAERMAFIEGMKSALKEQDSK